MIMTAQGSKGGSLICPCSATGLKFGNRVAAAQSGIRGITITNFTTGLDLGSDTILAVGNYIGTDSEGTPGGNNVGITVAGASQIGGTTAAERNVISDNQTGIAVTGGLGTLIEGNYIGPTPTGEGLFEDSGTGIAVDTGKNVTIGGTSPGSGNVISGLSRTRSPSALRRATSSKATSSD